MSKLLLFLAVSVAGGVGPDSEAAGTSVAIEVAELTSNRGVVECVLWAGPAGFPTETARGVAKVKAKVMTGTRTICLFERVPPGRFAVSLIHDENENGRMDTNFLGIPKETYGFSNNPSVMMRAPRFDEAAFTVADQPVVLRVTAK